MEKKRNDNNARYEAGVTIVSAHGETCRVELGRREIGLFSPGEHQDIVLPAGEGNFSVWEKHNYAHAMYEEGFFLPPESSSILILGWDGMLCILRESLPVMAEKGHFRVLNMTDGPITVKRRNGAAAMGEITSRCVSPYKMAGAGGYGFSFYMGEERIEEISFFLSEGEVLLIIVTPKSVLQYRERAIPKKGL